LGKRSADAGWYGAPLFSPQETAVVWQADPSVLRLTRLPGGSIDLATQLPSEPVVRFSPDDRFVLLHEADSDRVLPLGSGAALTLGRHLQPLSVIDWAGRPVESVWLGDGSRLLFREGTPSSSGTRVLTVDPNSGVVKHVADGDSGSQWVQLADNPELLIIDRSASLGQPQGLYQLTP
jgi:hypothetical protein